jgi:DNA-binding transcriptional ArsR family regulator
MDQATLDEIEQAVMAFDSRPPPAAFDAIAASLSGIAEDVVDLVLDHKYAAAEPIYRRLQRILDRFVAKRGLAIEQSDGCVAGQLRAFATLLGVISQRLPDSFEVEARKQLASPNYQKLFQALLKGDATTSELARTTGEKMETISRKLGTLRNLGLVTSYSLGRNVWSRLSPVAKDMFEQMAKDKPKPAAADRSPVFLVIAPALADRFSRSSQDGLHWAR